MSSPSNWTPRVADFQPSHEEVDKVVRRDGANVPLEPTQDQ